MGCDTARVLEFVEAQLDHIPQPIESMIHTNTHLAFLSHPLPGKVLRSNVPKGGFAAGYCFRSCFSECSQHRNPVLLTGLSALEDGRP